MRRAPRGPINWPQGGRFVGGNRGGAKAARPSKAALWVRATRPRQGRTPLHPAARLSLPVRAPAHARDYDPDARKLRVGDTLVIELGRQARGFATILNAFQERGWPHSLADPLGNCSDPAFERRLRDAASALTACATS